MSSITTVRHGSAAILALRRTLDERRLKDPLAPATVITRTSPQAAYIRKSLAETGGVAGVNVLPTQSFVAELAKRQMSLESQQPRSSLLRRAAIQAELLETSGALQNVATHQSTLQRLVDLSDSIRGVPRSALNRIRVAAPDLTADALEIVAGAEARLPAAASPTEQLEAALAELERNQQDQPIVVFAPLPQNAVEGRMLSGLAKRSEVHIIATMSGVDSVDTNYRRTLSGWGVQVPVDQVAANRALRLEVSDPADEVQAALREVLSSAADGVPLAAMAILYPSREPYASICFQQLEEAAIPVSGPGPRTLKDSVAARVLLQALDLLGSGLDRSAVVRFLNCGPICDVTGAPVPAVDWDHLSRRAGVVDAESWEPRLCEYEQTCSAAEKPDIEDRKPQRGGNGSELRSFVVELGKRVRSLTVAHTWREFGDWAISFLADYLAETSSWPEAERHGIEQVVDLLSALGDLDQILPTVNCDLFRSLLVSELDNSRPQLSPYGAGLLVAQIDEVCGVAFERVIVLGASEGTFPLSRREDPLLSDQLRSLAGHYLTPSAQSTALDQWSIAAALAGSKQPGVITHSRSELRSGRFRVWPQILDPLVAERRVLESHFQGVLSQGRPAAIEDFAIRELLRHTDAGEPLGSHPLAAADPALAAGLSRMRSRSNASLGPHTGQVSAAWLDLERRSFSPTALETYAGCPRRYLLSKILGISEHERPEKVAELSPRDRGSLLHKVLERFVGQALSRNEVPQPEVSWSDAQADQLFEIAAQEMQALQDAGLAGGRVQTRVSQRSLNTELTHFLATDNRLRAEYACTPAAVEYKFGFKTKATFRLTDGRRLKVRGSVDRVDTTAAGGLVVIDYKTGSSRGYTQMDSNPVGEGRRLQLPMYGSVVSEKFAASGDSFATYWMTRESKQVTMNLDPTLNEALDDTVGDLLSGISAGYFPAVPGDVVGYPRVTFENCAFCEFDRICPQDRQREWSQASDSDKSLLEMVRELPHG